MKLVKRSADYKCKCCVCGEIMLNCEPVWVVVRDNGTAVRGEKYCPDHKDYAYENNEELLQATLADNHQDDGESHLRAMEDFAAYRAAGCSSEYWNDQDAGYAF